MSFRKQFFMLILLLRLRGMICIIKANEKEKANIFHDNIFYCFS